MRVTGCFNAWVLALTLLTGACAPNAGPSAPAASPQSPPRELKRLVAAIQDNPATIFASNALTLNGSEGGATMFDLLSGGLAVTDDHGALRPQVASTIPSLGNVLAKLLADRYSETARKIRTAV